jgi:hypothetical protein
MKKLHEILRIAPVNGDVGVEIEVEGANLITSTNPLWNTTVDGSLRGENKEYILAKPLEQNEAIAAIIGLKQELSDAGSLLDFSFRTSVHVHVNVTDLTYDEYLSFLYTYLLLEEPLMSFCGKERKGNRFCLRARDAEGVINNFYNLFRIRDGFRNIVQDAVRYAALNIYSTCKFGSLEFRGMRGTLDTDVLSIWIKALVAIREFSRNKSPVQVEALYEAHTHKELMTLVLGDLAKSFFYPKMSQDIALSYSLSIDLPYQFRGIE